MDQIEIQFKLEKKDIQAINVVSKMLRLAPTWVKVVNGILGALSSIVFFFGNSEFIVAAITFWATFIYFTLASIIMAKGRFNLLWELNKTWHSPVKMKFAHSGVVLEFIYSKTEASWEEFYKVIESRDYIFFVVIALGIYVVPKKQLSDETVLELRNLLKERLGEKFENTSA
jgi:hypothetical protein